MSSTDEYIKEFDRRFVEAKAARAGEYGRHLNSSEVSSIRYALRRELQGTYPAEVAAVEHYFARNLTLNRKTGRPFPTHAEMAGDPQWMAGAGIEQRLRALSLSRGKKEGRGSRKPKPGNAEKNKQYSETLQSRFGNVRQRYYNMVKKYGYVPADDLTTTLTGITHRMAVEMRLGLADDYELADHQHGENIPEAFRTYWIATPKEDTTAKLVDIIQGLDEDNRKALIELLASIRNGS